MEFKGTRGKWFNGIGTEIVSMSGQVKVSKVSGSNYEEAKANALLISKAPEMLEMLQYILKEYRNSEGFSSHDSQLIENTIKQATEL